MKKLKFLPALALMMVAVLTFAFRPAPAAENSKVLAPVFYSYDGSDWHLETVEPSGCSGAGTICYIEFDGSTTVDPEDVEAAALQQIQPAVNGEYNFSFGDSEVGQIHSKN